MFYYMWEFVAYLKSLYFYLSNKRRLDKYGIKFAEKVYTDKQGRTFHWVGLENGTLGMFKEIADKLGGNFIQSICDVKELELRDDDVMICTYPRTGTHWVWEMTSMVMKGKAEHEVLPKESSMLEFQTPAGLAELPSPRILNGHQMPSFLPEQMFTKKIKTIHVYRNPKDVAVSLFHFSKKMPMLLPSMENKPYDTFSEFLPYFIGEYGVFFSNSIFEYYKEMEKFLGSRRDHTLNLCYEEMKRDPVGAVKQIAKFLDKNLSSDVITDIANKCSFKNLATADDKLKQTATLPVLDNPGEFGTAEMYRKGEVGDWQNYFTNVENKNFDKLVNEQFKDSEWKFIYTL